MSERSENDDVIGQRGPYKRTPVGERFWPKVDKAVFCWNWTAARTANGYGLFHLSDRSMVRAHRWAYENMIGPIPKGLDLDHLCRNRACVNPDHLEPVTRQVNLNRGRNFWREKTECPHGHPYDEANTKHYVSPSGQRVRFCRACRQRRSAELKMARAA